MGNDKERNELLQKMLNKELILLKRKCFKYKHDRPFITNKIVIKADDLKEYDSSCKSDMELLGIHNKIEESKYSFYHEILVSRKYIDAYMNYKRHWLGKTYYKNRLIQVIRHELVHAFVEEEFEIWSDIKGTYHDASVIFLSVLTWLGGYSGHECVKAFKRTELYKKLYTFKTYDELKLYLIKLLHGYEKIAREHEKGIIKNNLGIIDKYIFSPRGSGLVKRSQFKSVMFANNKAFNTEHNTFEIGCCIMPEQLEALTEKKRGSENFKYYQYDKKYITKANEVKTICSNGNIQNT